MAIYEISAAENGESEKNTHLTNYRCSEYLHTPSHLKLAIYEISAAENGESEALQIGGL